MLFRLPDQTKKTGIAKQEQQTTAVLLVHALLHDAEGALTAEYQKLDQQSAKTTRSICAKAPAKPADWYLVTHRPPNRADVATESTTTPTWTLGGHLPRRCAANKQHKCNCSCPFLICKLPAPLASILPMNPIFVAETSLR